MSLDFYLEYYIDKNKIEVFTLNITHNLTQMAIKCGIYYALWKPEEINCKYAEEIIAILEEGYIELKMFPDYYKKYEAKNGWGLYIHFVPFVKKVLDACKKYPSALIKVSI